MCKLYPSKSDVLSKFPPCKKTFLFAKEHLGSLEQKAARLVIKCKETEDPLLMCIGNLFLFGGLQGLLAFHYRNLEMFAHFGNQWLPLRGGCFFVRKKKKGRKEKEKKGRKNEGMKGGRKEERKEKKSTVVFENHTLQYKESTPVVLKAKWTLIWREISLDLNFATIW